jgi:chromate reductase
MPEYDRLKLIPPFDEDDEPAPPLAVTHWREAIDAADAILFATPEYNSSTPGQLKNAIDWASRPVNDAVLRNKPVAVIGASTGSFGALWSQADLRKTLGAAGARVTDRELPLAAAHEAFNDDETLQGPGSCPRARRDPRRTPPDDQTKARRVRRVSAQLRGSWRGSPARRAHPAAV